MNAPIAEANKSRAETLNTLISRLRNFMGAVRGSWADSGLRDHQLEVAGADHVAGIQRMVPEGLQLLPVHDGSAG